MFSVRDMTKNELDQRISNNSISNARMLQIKTYFQFVVNEGVVLHIIRSYGTVPVSYRYIPVPVTTTS